MFLMAMMNGVKVWFYVSGKHEFNPEKPVRAMAERSVSEIEAEIKGLGGKVTLFSFEADNFIPAVKLGFEFPSWGKAERNFVNGLLAELLNKALDEGTDIAFQFNPIRDEDPDGA